MEATVQSASDVIDDGADYIDYDYNEYSDEEKYANDGEIQSPLDESDIVKCNICFENVIKTVLQEHKELMHSSCKCPACGIDYTSQSLLHEHLRDEHTDTWNGLNCPYCPKVVSRKSNLLQHILYRHSRSREYQCTFYNCNLTFADRSELVQHEKTHDLGPVQNTCPVCHRFVGNLEAHMRMHNSSSYKCTLCQSMFSTRELLQTHMREQHPDYGYACKYCNLKFSGMDCVRKHERSIHEGIKHECPICHNLYNRRDNMVKHAYTIHEYRIPKKRRTE